MDLGFSADFLEKISLFSSTGAGQIRSVYEESGSR